ncbi:MAG: hypothetical protein WBA74_19775, partial [Cyclobacteriaceae bacterium]
PGYLNSITYKPSCFWFSQGTWLFGFDIDDSDLEEIEDYELKYVFIIDNPKNILRIENRKDMINFVNKYHFRDKSDYIDWNKVEEDGYYGIFFNFCHLTDIGLSYENEGYSWFSGFDVESLCIWDLRAFDNRGRVIKLKY